MACLLSLASIWYARTKPYSTRLYPSTSPKLSLTQRWAAHLTGFRIDYVRNWMARLARPYREAKRVEALAKQSSEDLKRSAQRLAEELDKKELHAK